MADRKMIYLDDAIDALAYFTEKSPTGRTAQEVVKDLPSAEPNRGKWEITNLGAVVAFDSCSECKRVVKHKAPFYNYCPNCGADMRGET